MFVFMALAAVAPPVVVFTFPVGVLLPELLRKFRLVPVLVVLLKAVGLPPVVVLNWEFRFALLKRTLPRWPGSNFTDVAASAFACVIETLLKRLYITGLM